MKLLLILIALAALTVAACFFWSRPPSGETSVRLFSWPSAYVGIDGRQSVEAPAPYSVPLSGGRHTFTFQPRGGGPPFVAGVELEGGKTYVLRADLDQRTYVLEVQR